MPHSAASADGSDAGFRATALKVPVTASVEWVRSAATRQGVVVYTHPTIHERGSGRMMSAATVPLVPLGHGWGGGGVGAGGQPHPEFGRQNGTELAETDLRVFRRRSTDLPHKGMPAGSHGGRAGRARQAASQANKLTVRTATPTSAASTTSRQRRDHASDKPRNPPQEAMSNCGRVPKTATMMRKIGSVGRLGSTCRPKWAIIWTLTSCAYWSQSAPRRLSGTFANKNDAIPSRPPISNPAQNA